MKTSLNLLLIILLMIMSSFTLSPFSTIVSPAVASYNSYQVKLTYTGMQLRPHPSLLIHGTGRLPNISEMTPYHSQGVDYSNDANPLTVAISGTSIKKFVDALNKKPAIKILGGSNNPTLSLMIQKGVAPAEVVFEHLADPGDAFTILNTLEAAITTESAATRDIVKTFRNYTIGYH